MSRFFSDKYAHLTPYTPGEQPREKKYIKLNTNESPYPPPPAVVAAATAEAGALQLYSDPECRELREALAGKFGLAKENIIVTNGSDEVLNFAFMAFADAKRPLLFPDITYGFYPVFAQLNNIPYEEIPLKEDFSIDPAEYTVPGKTVVIANPNAPTGKALPLAEIERIVAADPDRVVIIDEAYVDFGGESARCLVKRYPNLLVTGTFSKSYSMAGARLGFGVGDASLIRDLDTLRYSTNPYNVNRMTLACGKAALEADDIIMANVQKVIAARESTAAALRELGYEVTDSRANFLFVRSPRIGGEELYLALKERGILVRHFSLARIRDYNRITIGTPEQCEILLETIRNLEEKAGEGKQEK